MTSLAAVSADSPFAGSVTTATAILMDSADGAVFSLGLFLQQRHDVVREDGKLRRRFRLSAGCLGMCQHRQPVTDRTVSSLEGRTFRTVGTAEQGEATADTLFITKTTTLCGRDTAAEVFASATSSACERATSWTFVIRT